MKVTYFKAEYTYFVNFKSAKKDPDFLCHKFSASQYYDNYIAKELKEMNTAYSGFRCGKVVAHVTITMADKRYEYDADLDAKIKQVVVGPDQYLWHYSYDGQLNGVLCDRNSVTSKCLGFIKKWPKSDYVRHRISWYLRAHKWHYPEGDTFEKVQWEALITGQESSDCNQRTKVVCFGPILRNPANNNDHIHYSYLHYHYIPHSVLHCTLPLQPMFCSTPYITTTTHVLFYTIHYHYNPRSVLHRTVPLEPMFCSAPYITTGHASFLYNLLLVAVDIFLDCSTLIELK